MTKWSRNIYKIYTEDISMEAPMIKHGTKLASALFGQTK